MSYDIYDVRNMPNTEFIIYWIDKVLDDPICDCPECSRWFELIEDLITERYSNE
jgi:hypothetical protein